MPIYEQIVLFFLVTHGYLDEIPVSEVSRFEKDFLHYMQIEGQLFYGKLKETYNLDDELTEELIKLADRYHERFTVTT